MVVRQSDLADFYLAHDFDLTTATAPVVFSFNSFWSFEADYDYGYFEVSDDGGVTWDKLKDIQRDSWCSTMAAPAPTMR